MFYSHRGSAERYKTGVPRAAGAVCAVREEGRLGRERPAEPGSGPRRRRSVQHQQFTQLLPHATGPRLHGAPSAWLQTTTLRWPLRF